MSDPKPEQAEPGTVVEAAVDPDSTGAEPVAEPGPSTAEDGPGRAG